MIQREPPRMAVWLLKHWASPYQRESLVGDLFEMYRTGCSRTWYWRQVLAALILARARALHSFPHRGFGRTLLRLVNALLVAGIIALGIGSLTQADTTRIDGYSSHSR
jgi:hypothetical protein